MLTGVTAGMRDYLDPAVCTYGIVLLAPQSSSRGERRCTSVPGGGVTMHGGLVGGSAAGRRWLALLAGCRHVLLSRRHGYSNVRSTPDTLPSHDTTQTLSRGTDSIVRLQGPQSFSCMRRVKRSCLACAANRGRGQQDCIAPKVLGNTLLFIFSVCH